MPTEAMFNIVLARVTPEPGKGALGTRRFRGRGPSPGAEPDNMRVTNRSEAGGITGDHGTHAGQRLTFVVSGKTCG
jgi:hypothetical protein